MMPKRIVDKLGNFFLFPATYSLSNRAVYLTHNISLVLRYNFSKISMSMLRAVMSLRADMVLGVSKERKYLNLVKLS